MGDTTLGRAQLPGMRRLFADLLYDFPQVERFYPHPPSLDAASAAAAGIRLDSRHRQRLVDELGRQNQHGTAAVAASLERLADARSVVVATGQQVGLLGGPVFTLYKALTAVQCAAELTRRSTPAVPVFWLATEDHDLEEVNHAWAFTEAAAPKRLEATTTGSVGAAVGEIRLTNAQVDDFEACCQGLPYAADAVAYARAAYGEPTGFGSGFRALYRKLLADTGMLFLCPLEAGIRELAAPVMRSAIQRAPELTDALLRRGGVLRAAGYHQQVHFQESTSLLMLFEQAERVALKRKNGSYLAKARAYSSDDLLARLESSPLDVSPSALLRPVVQDFLLPTAALIAGPSEAAYLAQSSVLYENLLGRMPAVLPRATFTVLDEATRKLLERYEMTPADCMVQRGELTARVANAVVPPALRRTLDSRRAEIDGLLEEIAGALQKFDPTLGASFGNSRRKIGYQLEKSQSKVAREALRREATSQRHAARLADWVYPTENMQERVYSVLSFVAKFGPGFVEAIRAEIEPGCADHKVLAL